MLFRSWEDKKANLTMLEKKIMGLEADAQLVILPEMFSTGFTMNATQFAETMDGDTVKWMAEMSQKKRIILTGSIIIAEDDNFYNRLLWVMPDGSIGTYDKRHLFAFAGEDNHYSAGSQRLVTSVNGMKINLQICYDLRFPVWARQQEASEYDVLV